MMINYDMCEHKVVGKDSVLNVKACDNKEKIATVRFQFAPVIKQTGPGKSGNWSKNIDFQLDADSELIKYGQFLCGLRHHIEFPFHNSKTLKITRNSDCSVYYELKFESTTHQVVARDTDGFHLLTITCSAIANRYNISSLEVLTLLKSTPIFRG